MDLNRLFSFVAAFTALTAGVVMQRFADPARKARREMFTQFGRRQALKRIKAQRRATLARVA